MQALMLVAHASLTLGRPYQAGCSNAHARMTAGKMNVYGLISNSVLSHETPLNAMQIKDTDKGILPFSWTPL